MPRKRKDKSNWDLDPQKSSAAQFLTYIASAGAGGEKYEIRYEDENIWMSQKMLASVYGVEVPNIDYHMGKLFADAELDREAVIKEILTTAADGKAYSVKHYNLDVIIAIGFKIENERADAGKDHMGLTTWEDASDGKSPAARRNGVREVQANTGSPLHERLRPVPAGAGEPGGGEWRQKRRF